MNFTNENNLIENEECTIRYTGSLYQNNSDRVFIVYGFGNNWEHTSEKEMFKEENGFLAKIRMLQYNNIHFCFRNSNYEWDNNNYANYTLPILEADKNISPKTAENKIENEKNELLNNILEESNTQLDYVEEFDIDGLIEEILSPLLEETLYAVDDSDVPETKINETVTNLLNEELNKTETPLEETASFVQPDDFSMTDLIEDIRNDIMDTDSTVLTETKKTITSAKTIQLEKTDIQPTYTDATSAEDDFNMALSSTIVDEILEDISQIFSSVDFYTPDVTEETNQRASIFEPETVLETIEDDISQEETIIEELQNETQSDETLDIKNEDSENQNSDDDDSTPPTISIGNTDVSNHDVSEDVNDVETDIENEVKDQDESHDSANDSYFDPTAENDFSEENVAACTALTVRDEDRFVICSRKLSAFYMFRKKIKLAFYKVFYAIPRMIKRELNTNKNQD